jgi:hypothetical protein
MRVASRVAFGERNSGGRKLKKRYFLAFEGKVTERLYFEGLVGKLRREFLDSPLIEVVMFARKDEHEGHSNPRQLLQYTLDTISNGTFPLELTYQEAYEAFVSRLDAGMIDKRIKKQAFIKAQKFLSRIHTEIRSRVDVQNLDPFLHEVNEVFSQSLASKEGLEIVREIIDTYKSDDLLYEVGMDDVCIVVDRDAHSFTVDQYDEVMLKCEEEGFRLFVTNPCFEFFLLLHKTDCTQYSPKDVKENAKEHNCTFMERELKRYVSGYKKDSLRFLDFWDNLSDAMQNCLLYARSLIEIKDKIGTNLNILVQEFREPSL